MAKILKIYDQKEPILRSMSRTVEHIETWVLTLADDMWLTMLTAKSKGLSANQVGYDYRIITVYTSQFQGPMINPTIIHRSEETYHFAEGCLSAPGFLFDTGKRSKDIVVRFVNLNGKDETAMLSGDSAAVVQHEMDHLEGMLFMDYMDRRLNV